MIEEDDTDEFGESDQSDPSAGIIEELPESSDSSDFAAVQHAGLAEEIFNEIQEALTGTGASGAYAGSGTTGIILL